MPDENGMIGIKDFTTGSTTKKFKIDADIFEAARSLPLNTLRDIGRVAKNISKDSQDIDGEMEALLMLFEQVLLEDSFAVFKRRISDKTNPIGLEHIQPLLDWLLESYGFRPTPPSSNSSTGSNDGDASASLTAGASVGASTSLNLSPGAPST